MRPRDRPTHRGRRNHPWCRGGEPSNMFAVWNSQRRSRQNPPFGGRTQRRSILLIFLLFFLLVFFVLILFLVPLLARSQDARIDRSGGRRPTRRLGGLGSARFPPSQQVVNTRNWHRQDPLNFVILAEPGSASETPSPCSLGPATPVPCRM